MSKYGGVSGKIERVGYGGYSLGATYEMQTFCLIATLSKRFGGCRRRRIREIKNNSFIDPLTLSIVLSQCRLSSGARKYD